MAVTISWDPPPFRHRRAASPHLRDLRRNVSARSLMHRVFGTPFAAPLPRTATPKPSPHPPPPPMSESAFFWTSSYPLLLPSLALRPTHSTAASSFHAKDHLTNKKPGQLKRFPLRSSPRPLFIDTIHQAICFGRMPNRRV